MPWITKPQLFACALLAALPTFAAASENASAAAASELSAGLVGYYPLDGNALDGSGRGNHGVVNGALATADRFGAPNAAYRFDGDGDYIRTADSTSLNLTGDLTIAAWIRPSRVNNGSIIFSNMLEVSPHSGYQLRFAYNGVVRFMSGDQSLFGNTVVPLDTWTHVAATLTGTTARVYLNGTLDLAGTVGVPTSSNVDQTIGSSYSPFYFYQGVMDEVRIYDRALSAADVQQLTLVPEPASLLLGTGLAAAASLRRRRPIR